MTLIPTSGQTLYSAPLPQTWGRGSPRAVLLVMQGSAYGARAGLGAGLRAGGVGGCRVGG